MGRKDKHKPGASRNNAVFKVVGAKVGKQAKGRPKGVDIKLKKLNSEKQKGDVASLDAQLVSLQHKAVPMGRTAKPAAPAAKLAPAPPPVKKADLDSIVMDFEKATAK